MLLAIGLVVVEFLDDRVRDPEELQRRFGLAPLAALPFVRQGGARPLADSAQSASEGLIETVRLLRTNLGSVTAGRPAAIGVSGAARGHGASIVAANLGGAGLGRPGRLHAPPRAYTDALAAAGIPVTSLGMRRGVPDPARRHP